MRRMALIVVLSALLASTMSAAAADHELKLIPSNTHTGSFDARIKPVLRIAPGDTVKVETSVPFGMDRLLAAGASGSLRATAADRYSHPRSPNAQVAVSRQP
jgi:hypothetical protein